MFSPTILACSECGGGNSFLGNVWVTRADEAERSPELEWTPQGAMDAYFSHSYRDVPINTYFRHLFDQAGITLLADQKSDVWCMAKLERYMFHMAGFVSIIPRRVKPDESLTYSPYIGRELLLARRARTPRVLFVDSQILEDNPDDFPSTAVPFYHREPETELTRHVEAISAFRRTLSEGGARPPRQYNEHEVTVVAGEGALLRDAASHVSAILRADGYTPHVKSAMGGLDQAFDDIDAFESLLRSELCVFVMGTSMASADALLAMAHAHCIPSMRLRHDPQATTTEPELSGVVRWSTPADLKPGFLKLFRNYQSVFANLTGTADLEKVATPTDALRSLTLWDTTDRRGLIVHIRPDDAYVHDRMDGVRRVLATDAGRVESDRVCRELYDRVKKERFYYTFEPVLSQPNQQRIRTPKEIAALNCGTCIDFACLFAALLEAAHERPVVIVTRGSGVAHALAGYVTPDAIFGDSAMTLGELRGAVRRGEVVVFETTGAVEAQSGRVVAAETLEERNEGNRMLDYTTAKSAAKQFLENRDIDLVHFVDVQRERRGVGP